MAEAVVQDIKNQTVKPFHEAGLYILFMYIL